MSYFAELDAWLEDLGEDYGIRKNLAPGDWDDFKQELKDKALESYRNGERAGKGTPNNEAEEKSERDPVTTDEPISTRRARRNAGSRPRARKGRRAD